jgi:hypothetical protein
MAQSKTLEEKLFDKMYELDEQYRAVLDTRASNRTVLRDLVKQGVLTAEQDAAVNEMYPERAARGTAEATE